MPDSGKEHHEQQVPACCPALSPEADSKEQLRAIKEAAAQKNARAVPELIKLIESIFDPYEPSTRQLLESAVRALGEIGDRRAIPTLMKQLHNAFYKIQAEAVKALGKIQAEEAVDSIRQITRNICAPDFLRLAAVEALGEIASKQAINHLQQLAEDDQIPSALQRKASQALHSIQGFW